MPPSKNDHEKALRGVDLTPVEFRVLIMLRTYTDAQLGNAHPGFARLAADSRITTRYVKQVVESLISKGYVELTSPGGNAVGKGLANTYRVVTDLPRGNGRAPFEPGKGEPQNTLRHPQGGTTEHPSEVSDLTPRVNWGADEGGTGVHGKGDPQFTPSRSTYITSKEHHSDPLGSGSPGGERHQVDGGQVDEIDVANQLEQLDRQLDGLDAFERNRAEAMMQNGRHPKAVRNSVLKQRRDITGNLTAALVDRIGPLTDLELQLGARMMKEGRRLTDIETQIRIGRADQRPCTICGRGEHMCRRVSQNKSAGRDHDYTPEKTA